ncbi:hypothetical protein D3C71_1633430 [compost metagenome]
MKLRNSRISTPKIKPIPAMIASPKLANSSCMPSASPYSGLETPAGRFFRNGKASTAALAWPNDAPLTSASSVMRRSRSKRSMCDSPT